MDSTLIKFNLKKGMKGDSVLNELNGKVSGETRELYQTFAKPGFAHAEPLKDPLHRVIATGHAYGQKYAIIEKIHTHATLERWSLLSEDEQSIETARLLNEEMKGSDYEQVQDKVSTEYKTLKTDRTYYLTGLNDEGTYFVHPLDPESIKTYWKFGNFKKLLDFVNKTIDGYVRTQGDVLIKKIFEFEIVQGVYTGNSDEGITFDEENKKMVLIKPITESARKIQQAERDSRAGWGTAMIPSFSQGPTGDIEVPDKYFDMATGETKELKDVKKEGWKATDMTRDEYEQEYLKRMERQNGALPVDVVPEEEEMKLVNPIPLFGNHFLYANGGKVYAGEKSVVVMGTQKILLDHNEHKPVYVDIPKDKACVITTQRGVTAIEGIRVGYD